MKHPLDISKYDGTLDELARDIATLRYDKLAEFLSDLSDCIEADSYADTKRGYVQLGNSLHSLSMKLDSAEFEGWNAWGICKPHMQPTPEEIDKAWELYCECSAGAFSAVDCWENLGKNAQKKYIARIRNV